jgi:hypothetical protein
MINIGSEKSKVMDNTQETFFKGSSETTRAAYDIKFLDWFVGFTEGNGAFIVNKNGSLEFKITQSSKDAAILFYIKKILRFGTVSVQSKASKTHHFRVRDKKYLIIIIFIFNGFLQLDKSKIKFSNFVKAFNLYYKENIILTNILINLINLDSAWLCGFTDAEGCFTVTVIENLNRKNASVQVRYYLSQKGEKDVMERIAFLFYGRISYLVSYDGYNMCVNLTYLKVVLEYFKIFKLKTLKYVSYLKWLKIYEWVICKKHIESKFILEKIKILATDINVH